MGKKKVASKYDTVKWRGQGGSESVVVKSGAAKKAVTPRLQVGVSGWE